MPLYVNGGAPQSLPTTERMAAKCVTLPISASMTLADADDVLDSFEAVYR
jgi:dTDP-4-amino-4,6-dideoxygalactose transaminase